MSLLDTLIFGVRSIFFGDTEYVSRSALEFEGADIAVTDDPVKKRTKVTFTGQGPVGPIGPPGSGATAPTASLLWQTTILPGLGPDIAVFFVNRTGAAISFAGFSLIAFKQPVTQDDTDYVALTLVHWPLNTDPMATATVIFDVTTKATGGINIQPGTTVDLGAPFSLPDGHQIGLVIDHGGAGKDMPPFYLCGR